LSGRGLCDELITRPEESYRLCCVVVCDLETSRFGAPSICDISSLRVKSYPNNIKCANCSPPGYYTESSGNSLPTVRDNLSVPLLVETDKLCRNVCQELPLLSVK
jgi:hypothetical protein